MSEKKVLEMKGITKIYPGVRALDGVDFIVEEGSVHALMGENGAGKSTLIKILTGVIGKDSGSIVLSGKEVNFHSVYEANNNGISAVYQELDLIPELSIGENIFMGREMMKKGSIDWKNTYKEADKILKSMGDFIGCYCETFKFRHSHAADGLNSKSHLHKITDCRFG